MIGRLAWVSALAARGLDEDEPLALAALTRAGVRVDVVAWDDPEVQWSTYERAILRSTWDYPERLPEFQRWLATVDAATDLRNPVDAVGWSTDKHYLADLEQAGVPITPTSFLEPGAGDDIDEPGGFVVKPAVGAGSRDVASYGPDQVDLARAHVRRLHDRRATALIQPLLASVAVDGEWPLVYLGGTYSHAANKRVDVPRAAAVTGLFAAERTAPHAAEPAQRSVADAAMRVVTERFGPLTYARVDLVRDAGGHYCVLEVELVEPSLFLPLAGDEAVERLVSAFISS